MESSKGGVLNNENFLIGTGEMASLIRERDWSNTSLGPVENWPQSLRTTVSICLASNFPINIIWGPDHVQIYNDGYRVVCGEGHPAFLGMSYPKSWASAWPAIGAPFEDALKGKTSFLENQRMFLSRNGYLEETFFTFSLSPIRDESGGVGGLFHPVTETTRTILGERRTRALRDLTARLGEAKTTAEVYEFSADILSQFAFDLPFVAFYERDGDGEGVRALSNTGLGDLIDQARLIERAPSLAGSPLAQNKTARLDGAGDFLPETCGPYDEVPNIAFAVRLDPSTVEQPRDIMIAGVSPRLPLDEAYEGFYGLIGSAIAAALANVRAIEQERKRLEALAALDKAKTAFFSNVSHEFRTPLTLLLGPLEEMAADSGRHGEEQIQLAYRNALRLQKLVNSLLDFSRIEAGRAQASFVATDLAALTGDLASNFRSATEKAGLDLVVDFPSLSQAVYVDRDMWEKVVLNLLSNAFKFTLDGTITVSLRETGSGAVLQVSDTGVGIPTAELPRVFERFHRIEGQRSRTHEGTGIGLALVDELVRLHGGTIVVESNEDVGTIFKVSIPFGKEHLDAEKIATRKTQSSTAVGADAFVAEALRWLPDEPDLGADAAPGSQGSGRIVLADDNADMRSYVTRILSERGYEVTAVANGAAVLEAVKKTLPDLVLTDVMMPELDGFGLLAALRSNERTADLPVILLSARAGEEARIEGLGAGADDYIVKPFSATELIARVGSTLRLEEQRSRSSKNERATLRLTEARLQVALQAGQLGAWELHVESGEVKRSSLHDRVFGYDEPRATWTYQDFMDHVLPEDKDRVDASLHEAIAQKGVWHFECRIRRADGEVRWIEALGGPAPETDGSVETMLGVVSDITDRKLHDERQKTLLDELNHRVKNTLATVQSITTQTQKSSATPEAFAHALEGRVLALSRAHELLTESAWQGASLQDVVQRSMSAQRVNEERVSIAGPRIRLDPNATVSLSMAFHELTGNAVQFGAMSNDSGHVDVSWSLDGVDPGVINVVWQESGGPPVNAPLERGFGSRLLERALPRELGGTISLEFNSDGLRCAMRLPLSRKLETMA
ncbi:response regulator [Agrobacterium vitis]|uniref:ATP-binding protein n=1 Tax=Agrobacterium vitis TaxID=373 RepID=UPI0012E94B19|nr:ATP-binding protein [Agrobacterium vitis]MVA12187.1 response regulator [Agrobacterium vitis]